MCYKKSRAPERISITPHRILDFLLTRVGPTELICDAILILLLTVAWFQPQVANNFFTAIERSGEQFARKKNLAILAIAAAAILLRVSLLIFQPVPVPLVHDEFAHLLAADTFAHGHLTNPPHPMWEFLDTVHVNQQPTYMSKYPPAQGAILAVGQALGNPWIGVLLSIALMCAAGLWMLQGWLPPQWALLGGILILFRLGIASYWINGYWGGAVPAIGGALVLGALPRIMKFPRALDAVLLALGTAILANSRPVEGLIVCVPAVMVLFAWLFRKSSPPGSVTFPRIVIPFCAVWLCAGAFMGYYNWRLTGNALLFPEVLNERMYASSPEFIWQKLGPALHYSNAQFESFYNGWTRQYWTENQVNTIPNAAKHAGIVIVKFVYFFLWPELLIPLLALPWMLRDRRIRFLNAQMALCFAGWFAVVWFLPHYAGPATVVIFALVAQGLRHLRRWRVAGRPVGIGLTRVVITLAIILAPWHQRGGTLPRVTPNLPPIADRAKFTAELTAIPGEHLVLVRYGKIQLDSGEWVYNAANIDNAKIVWAREIPGKDNKPLLNYFHDRQVWVAEPDANPPKLGKYQ
jgi:hypothetical protein